MTISACRRVIELWFPGRSGLAHQERADTIERANTSLDLDGALDRLERIAAIARRFTNPDDRLRLEHSLSAAAITLVRIIAIVDQEQP